MTRIAIPPTDVSVTLDSRALLNPYGHVTGIAYDNSGPRLTLRLHDGTRLVLAREGDTWILGPYEGEDILAVTKLNGSDGRIAPAALDAINELWQAACSAIDQLAAPIVQAASGDLTRPRPDRTPVLTPRSTTNRK